MQKIKDMFDNVLDKLAHVGAGAIAAFVVFWIVSYFSIKIALIAAFVVTVLVAIAKEILDSKTNGVCSAWDGVSTIIGGALIIGAIQIGVMNV